MKRLVLALLAAALGTGCGDRDRLPGEIQGGRRPALQEPAVRGDDGRSILFGDLHVHTTYSIDAFIYSLPLFGGEGAHPPADACDYARYCSALDFFALTDHAEGLPPEKWRRIKESIRQCNAVAGDPDDPDMVAFVGWEWTQAASTPERHYGHKNVIFPELDDSTLPARPIHSLSAGTQDRAPPAWMMDVAQGALALAGQGGYADFLWAIGRMAEVPECPTGVDTRELPQECSEGAPTPAELFEKLRQWGLDVLVIPHGLAWGLHAPPGASVDLQLDRANHDPERQRLLEVYSGHGNSEEYRAFEVVREEGEPVCPEPTEDFLPCCWRAGEIVRERCGDLPEAECEARVVEARRLALEAGPKPQRVLPDASPEDWLDCDQCRDCFKPAYSLRPRLSAQYALALGNFDQPAADGRPLRFRFGFIGSSDDHKAQPGTGYKQQRRLENSDARGVASERASRWLHPLVMGRQQDPQRAQPAPPPSERGFRDLMDVERVASFMYPGGLVAVHAEARDRGAIWRALQRREVYGTSGPRILLWFHLLNGPDGREPMGAAARLDETPRFEVRAVGSLEQQPGCPEARRPALSPERLETLCGGECYHPGDRRHPIRTIEVVRIRPQQEPGEEISALVEDPWLRFDCPPDPEGCRVFFEDPDYTGSGRDSIYYVRALQEETPAINGDNLRPVRDESGRVVDVRPCFGNYKTSEDDDCLAPVQERAWSSPIFVEQAALSPARDSHSAP